MHPSKRRAPELLFNCPTSSPYSSHPPGFYVPQRHGKLTAVIHTRPSFFPDGLTVGSQRQLFSRDDHEPAVCKVSQDPESRIQTSGSSQKIRDSSTRLQVPDRALGAFSPPTLGLSQGYLHPPPSTSVHLQPTRLRFFSTFSWTSQLIIQSSSPPSFTPSSCPGSSCFTPARNYVAACSTPPSTTTLPDGAQLAFSK